MRIPINTMVRLGIGTAIMEPKRRKHKKDYQYPFTFSLTEEISGKYMQILFIFSSYHTVPVGCRASLGARPSAGGAMIKCNITSRNNLWFSLSCFPPWPLGVIRRCATLWWIPDPCCCPPQIWLQLSLDHGRKATQGHVLLLRRDAVACL